MQILSRLTGWSRESSRALTLEELLVELEIAVELERELTPSE